MVLYIARVTRWCNRRQTRCSWRNSKEGSSESRRWRGRLFQKRGPATVNDRSSRLVQVCGALHVAVMDEPSERLNESCYCLSADCFVLYVMTSEELLSVIDMIVVLLVFMYSYFVCTAMFWTICQYPRTVHILMIWVRAFDNITTGKNWWGRHNLCRCQISLKWKSYNTRQNFPLLSSFH